MREITLDGSSWQNGTDFYRALFAVIGAPDWHGTGPDALVDSMIWGGINALDPPYVIRIVGMDKVPKQVKIDVVEVIGALQRGRASHVAITGKDVDVAIKVEP
jgi:RNAse (barnase) inhibitor barstar